MASKFLKLTWYQDLKAETDLRRMAVSFEIESIPFNKIDLKESQVNGARLGEAIIQSKVEDYMQGFRNGDTFPRPIMHKTATGYVILGGNQRCESIRRLIAEGELPKDVQVEIYLVETKDKFLLEIIARSANVAHGQGSDKAERLAHAIYCVRSLGMRTADAAKQFMVAESTINMHIKAEEQRKDLAAAGVDAHRVPNAVLAPLAKLDFDAGTKQKLGQLVAQHGPTAERTRQVVATMTKETSSQGRNRVLKEFEKELHVAAHGNGHTKNGHTESERSKVPLRPRREKAFRLASSLANFLESENGGEPFTTLEEMQISSDADRDRMVKLCNKLTYRLRVLAK